MGPARFHCATLLLINNVLKFNYAFPQKAFKNSPLTLCILFVSVICYMELPCCMFYIRCLCSLFILLNEKRFFFVTASVEQN